MIGSPSALKRIAMALSSLDRFTPVWFKKVFYRGPYFLLKNYLSLVKSEGSLWLRNSVLFNEVVFPISDIDLTFRFASVLKKEEVQRIETIVRRWRVLLPHIGEIAYLDQEGLESFSQFANPYELKRDPRLLESIEIKSKEGEGRDIAFILRWMESDIHQLLLDFPGRSRKIKRFLKLLERKYFNIDNFEELIERLLDDPDNSNEIITSQKREIKEILSILALRNSVELEALKTKEELFRTLLIFFPHYWMGLPIEQRVTIWEQCLISAGEQEVCQAQLEWEIWGLYQQLPRVGNINSTLIHLESMKHLATLLKSHTLINACVNLEKYSLAFWDTGEGK